jgi:hypothetical protein
MTTDENLPSTQAYSTLGRFIFWAMWTTGTGVCGLFIISIVLAEAARLKYMLAWSVFAVVIHVTILLRAKHHFYAEEKPMSEVLLWAVLMGIVMPFINFGGCVVISKYDPLHF